MEHFVSSRSALITFGLCFMIIQSFHPSYGNNNLHPEHLYKSSRRLAQRSTVQYESAEFWVKHAQDELKRKVDFKETANMEGIAKNILFFLGDGMSVPTITAARILKGQKVDSDVTWGEEASLYMDSLPNIAVSKTFCSDAQVADSACSATAYLSGVKNNYATIGVTSDVKLGDCEGHSDPKYHVSSILAWAQAAGKSTGVVTTANICDASPAGTYAHTANRNWNTDKDVKEASCNPLTTKDIATQLILEEPGKNINVIMGGGRRKFMLDSEKDPETSESGQREDKNLIEEWKKLKEGKNAVYVENRTEFLKIDVSSTDYVLGLFGASEVAYLDEQEKMDDPSLQEMTKMAIEILSRNPNGFFLFVEGGRIDHAHHANQPLRALWETIEFDKAIKLGDDMTDDTNTTIVVTADHAHVMSIAGYPERGNPINHIAKLSNVDGLPFNTLGYANGPGYRNYTDGKRPDITGEDFDDPTYQPPVALPYDSETHGGDDVLVFSKGPYSHLLSGVHMQSYIPHVLAYASCMGSNSKAPECDSTAPKDKVKDSGAKTAESKFITFSSITLVIAVTRLFIQ